MSVKPSLYETDFYAWTHQQAALLRKNKWRELDVANLAEEVESLGRRDKRELGSRLQVLLVHLLKWCYQPERREDSHSWTDTIVEQREQIEDLLADSPSLRPQVPELLTLRYVRARRRALRDTGLAEAVLPQMCPWTIEQALDDAFWPHATPE
jgi:hypothetical protein